jgi:hypothetical protein
MEIKWLKAHSKKVLAHGSILSAFLLYTLFLAGPLFDRFERIDGETRLHDASLPGETNNIRYGFRLEIPMDAVEIEGWAFIESQSPENSEIHVVLASPDTNYVFDTLAAEEVDLNKQLDIESLDLSCAAFSSFFLVGNIKDGEYKVGIYITKGNIEALEYTNKVIVKSGNAVRQVTPN